MGLLDDDAPRGLLFGNARAGLLGGSAPPQNALAALLAVPMEAPAMARNALVDVLAGIPRAFGFAQPPTSVAEGFRAAPQNALAALGMLPMGGPRGMPPAASPQAVAPDALALARQLALTPAAPLPDNPYMMAQNVKAKHLQAGTYLSPQDLGKLGAVAPDDILTWPIDRRREWAAGILGRAVPGRPEAPPPPAGAGTFAAQEAQRRAAALATQNQQIAAGRSAVGDAEASMVRAFNDRVAADVKSAGARGYDGIAADPLFQPAASADDIAGSPNPAAQGKAFEAFLSSRGIRAQRIAASDTSDYYAVSVPGRDDPLKVRFSDHANTSRLHRQPDINVAPGGDHTFYDAILAVLGR